MQTRRSVLTTGAALLAGAAAAPLIGRDAQAAMPRARLMPFDYGDIALLDGPLKRQFDATHATLLALDEDALLKPYRAKAGLATPGPNFGGWYNASPRFDPPRDMHGFIPGHSFGQHVSALARFAAITGDRASREKVQRLVAGFAPTITSKFYDGYPLPAYTFDKINCGLIDAHAFAQDRQALKVLNHALDAALPHLPAKALTRPEMRKLLPMPNIAFDWDESYTLPENLYLAWKRGAGARFHKLAQRYLLDKEYFDPLAEGDNVLPHKHAYSHVNAFSSAMQAWLIDGSEKHLRAARNGFDFVLAQSFATGGWGPNEGFVEPGSGALGESLHTTHASFETPCGSYGHFKAGRYLMRATGDSRYGDSMERILYNTVLGALPMKPDGTGFYYSDYNDIGAKTYFEYHCPCCFGTLGQVVADYGISSYFRDADGIFVNLYVPSRLRWRRGGKTIVLEQRTQYPLSSDIALMVRTPSPERFAVRLRIPAWAGANTAVSINGRRHAMDLMPGHFAEIHREWNDGDRIELTLDQPTRLEAVDDQHKDLVALMHGPLALFATGQRLLPMRREEVLSARQLGATAEWKAQALSGTQSFKPFYAIDNETTRLYQPLSA